MAQPSIMDHLAGEGHLSAGAPATLARLAGGVAHEVRNPLAIIRMGLDNLARSLPDHPDRARLFLDDLYEAVERTERIVDALLKFGAPRPLNYERVAAADLIREAVTTVQSLSLEEGIQVSLDIDSDVPPLRLDRAMVLEVLQQILSNAFHAMPGGGTVTITATTRPGSPGFDGAVIIEVCDTGEGIPPASLPKLFDPFFTTRQGQLGLGLPIAQVVMELHGGRIEIEPNEGGGTVARLAFRV